MMDVVHARELPELGLAKAGLRAVEARAAGFVPEPVEDREDGGRVAVPQGADDQRRAVPGGDDAGVHGSVGKTYYGRVGKVNPL